jgi:hypothetical protein
MIDFNKKLLIWGATACIGLYLSVAHDESLAHAMNAATLVATVQTLLDNDREENDKGNEQGNNDKGDREATP